MKVIPLSLLIIILAACIKQDENSFSDRRNDSTYRLIETADAKWMADNLVYLDKDIYNRGAWIWNCEETDFERCGNCSYAGQCVFYNWKTAKTSCPDGWHLPGRKEWEDLIAYYSSDDHASPAFKGFNLSFDGRARVFNEFCLLEGNTFWTSDSDKNDNLGISVAIHFSSDGEIICTFEESPKENAFYVRCIEDEAK